MAGRRVGVLAALLLAAPVLAGADDAPVAPEADASAKATAAAEAKAEAPPAPFKPPPGFRTKKRGDMTLYCRREAVLGSRFQAEKCYDEEGVRQIKLAELEQAEILERMKVCTKGSCTAN